MAFSGEVRDPEICPDGFTERSQTLNPGLKGELREAFKGNAYQILLVANKFQTGFNQPLLCGMYVDRRLDGIQAVQTLSRLNRCHPGKDTTYVVDFVNEPDDILAAFKTYYATAELAEATDPNLILDLKTKLDAQGHYDDVEIDRVVKVLYAEESNDGDARKRAKDELDALILFRSDMGTYVRFYTFLSQIYDYANTGLEKRAIFYKALLPLLEFEREIHTVDLSKVVLTRHHLRHLGTKKLDLSQGDSPPIPGMAPAGGAVQDKQKVELAEIIAKLNELFSGELSDNDKLPYVCSVIRGKLMESATLQ